MVRWRQRLDLSEMARQNAEAPVKSGVVLLAPTMKTFTIILDFSQQYSTVGIGCCLLNLLLHYSKKFTFFEQVSDISLRKWNFQQQNVPEFFIH